MSYFSEWEQLIKNQTKATFNDFWIKYSRTEKRIYNSLLDNPGKIIMGKFSELVQKYHADPVIFMGFLDGINNSLNEKQNLENLNDDSDIKLDINLERLYLNMLGAKADYLYNLLQWDDILTKEKKHKILKTRAEIGRALNEKQNLENLNDDLDIKLDINLERLYLNMLGAKADYLYNLPQWDDILTKEKKREILKTHRKRNTVVKNNKIGRNDSCPCGSGKKYKHCCGK